MSNVVAIRKCGRCGKPARTRTLVDGDQELGEIIGCDACVKQTQDELANVRPVFEALLACGAEHEFADQLMTQLLAHLYPSAESKP